MVQITYYGHSCFMVNLAGTKILFDPFITPNELAKDIDITTINPDYILLSHGHGDHVADAVSIAKQSGAMCIGVYEVMSWLNAQGVKNTHEMNTGGSREFDFGKAKLVNAVHSSSMPDGAYGGNPIGFVITGKEHTFYYAGDTALTMDMKLIPERHKLDFAFLPIGDNFTMDYIDAARAAEFIKCDDIIGMHYDTFGYIKVDHEAAQNAFSQKGKTLTLMKIGETLEK